MGGLVHVMHAFISCMHVCEGLCALCVIHDGHVYSLGVYVNVVCLSMT